MKKMLILIISLVAHNNISAQIIDELTIELNIVRYAPSSGLNNYQYANEFTFINGFNISYGQSKKMSYFIGLRKVSSSTNWGGGFTYESTTTNGFEYRLGTKFSFNRNKIFFPAFGLDFFGEFSTLQGYFWNDYPPTYELNHRKNYIGFAPSIELNFRLWDRIIIFTESRLRLGMVNLYSMGSTDRNLESYPNENYWNNSFELFNAIGLKFEL